MNSTASAGGIRGSIAARLDRLPLTGYQKKLFAIIATAWFFDSMDLGAMTFILGSIKAEFGLSPAQAGLLASSSFFGMFLGAAIAGMLAKKQYIPESNGTLKTDTSTFGLMVFAVIFIVAALSFFPALTLGPIAEYFSAQ